MDYIKDLSPKEQEWLDKFAGEYYGASLDFQNRRKNIHKNKRLMKECTDRNNRQNNDLLGVTKITGLLTNNILTDYKHPAQEKAEMQEDALIEYIDNKHLLLLSEEELRSHLKFQNFIESEEEQARVLKQLLKRKRKSRKSRNTD